MGARRGFGYQLSCLLSCPFTRDAIKPETVRFIYLWINRIKGHQSHKTTLRQQRDLSCGKEGIPGGPCPPLPQLPPGPPALHRSPGPSRAALRPCTRPGPHTASAARPGAQVPFELSLCSGDQRAGICTLPAPRRLWLPGPALPPPPKEAPDAQVSPTGG